MCLQELRQLQQQAGSSGPCSSTVSDSSVCQDASQAAASQQQQEQQQQQQSELPSLEEQQRHAARMKLLLRKDSLLRAIAVCYTFGCLTPLQLAKLHVYSSPYYPHPLTFVAVITEQVEQEQQQQRRVAMKELLQDTESCAGGSSD
jgi:Na+/glutamate symporter